MDSLVIFKESKDIVLGESLKLVIFQYIFFILYNSFVYVGNKDINLLGVLSMGNNFHLVKFKSDKVKLGHGLIALGLANYAFKDVPFSTGIAIFDPGVSIPLHSHNSDEQITILSGNGIAEIEGKVFPVERRGGFPWAEGASGQNLHAQLPLKLAYDGRPSDVTLYCAEDLNEAPQGKSDVSLRLTIYGSEPGDKLDVKLNGKLLDAGYFDYNWKDPKIFSPLPQQNAGSYGYREVDPKQRLLLVTYNLDPNYVLLGDNMVSICLTHMAAPYNARTSGSVARKLQVEKIELHV